VRGRDEEADGTTDRRDLGDRHAALSGCSGVISEDLPGPALNLARFLGAIVAWVTSGRSSPDPRTNVPCRRSPGRRRCAGEILASFEADGSTIV